MAAKRSGGAAAAYDRKASSPATPSFVTHRARGRMNSSPFHAAIRRPAAARHCAAEPLEPRRLFAAELTLFDSGGFEPPRYAPGALLMQDPMGPWLKDPGTGSATVQTASARSGTQAVRVTRPAAATGDTRHAVVRPFAPAGDLDVLRVSWDMNVTRNAQPGVAFGPFFGVEAYDTVAGAPLLIGSLGVDATTGDVLYQDGTTGALTETGATVTPGQWNHFLLEVDYGAGEYTVFVDGAAVAATGFVDDGAAGFSDASVAALAASANTVATASGSALFDNYKVEVHAEPTPPAVTAVYVAGSAWAGPFKGLMEAKNRGSAAHGYRLPAGAGQLDALPWRNLDRVTLAFNRDVRVAADDLSVRGARGGAYGVVGFAYDRARRTATWSLDRPLGRDAVTVTLAGGAAGVRSRDGVTPLDGEWADGADAFPTGDGASGGDFHFRVNVVPGDVNRNGRTDATDLVDTRSRVGVRTSRLRPWRIGYTLFHDLNGDGRLNVLDVAAVRWELAFRPE